MPEVPVRDALIPGRASFCCVASISGMLMRLVGEACLLLILDRPPAFRGAATQCVARRSTATGGVRCLGQYHSSSQSIKFPRKQADDDCPGRACAM
jgi:hypothetical protein